MPSLVEIGPVVHEEKIFFSSMYFRFFVIISPWKWAVPFIWTNYGPLYPRMLCAKFGWNWSSGSWEEDENVKGLRHRQRRDDNDDNDDRQQTNFDHKSSLEPSDQVS